MAKLTSAQFDALCAFVAYSTRSLTSALDHEVANEARVLTSCMAELREARLLRNNERLSARREDVLAQADRAIRTRFLRAKIEATVNEFPPGEVVIDWGSRTGLGKRSGRMVAGAMADPPQGKKTYKDALANLPDLNEHRAELRLLHVRSDGREFIETYLKARSAKLSHHDAMVCAYEIHD